MLIEKIKKYLHNEPTLFKNSFNPEYDILAKDIADKIIAKEAEKLDLKNNDQDFDVIKTRRSEIDGEDFRTVGAEHVSLWGAERIGLLEVFNSLNIGEEKAKIGLAAVIARMVHPGSERETLRWLFDDSSLLELLGIDINSENSLHRTIDLIYENKDFIESKIYSQPPPAKAGGLLIRLKSLFSGSSRFLQSINYHQLIAGGLTLLISRKYRHLLCHVPDFGHNFLSHHR
jgi:hypothetical protein